MGQINVAAARITDSCPISTPKLNPINDGQNCSVGKPTSFINPANPIPWKSPNPSIIKNRHLVNACPDTGSIATIAIESAISGSTIDGGGVIKPAAVRPSVIVCARVKTDI